MLADKSSRSEALNILLRRKHSCLSLLSIRAMREMPNSELQDAARYMCSNVPLLDNTVLCRVLGRYKMLTNTADVSFCPHIMLDGFWQMWVTRVILNTVREGMWVADVGANVGYFTLLLGDIVGDSGHVHSIEPDTHNLSLLQQSVALNGFAGRVDFYRKAAPAVEDPAPAKVPVVRSLDAAAARRATIARTARAKPAPAAASNPGQKGVCLDDIVRDERLDFVRVEGNGLERDIWRGMKRILARQQSLSIVLTFTVDRYRDPDVFLAEMAAARFKLSRVSTTGRTIDVSAEEVLAFPSGASQTLSLSR